MDNKYDRDSRVCIYTFTACTCERSIADYKKMWYACLHVPPVFIQINEAKYLMSKRLPNESLKYMLCVQNKITKSISWRGDDKIHLYALPVSVVRRSGNQKCLWNTNLRWPPIYVDINSLQVTEITRFTWTYFLDMYMGRQVTVCLVDSITVGKAYFLHVDRHQS